MTPISLTMISPRHAILSGEPQNASIEILLKPFLWKDTLVDTSIRLDGIDLPSLHLSELAGKQFNFPLNPEDGAIDGSIYLDNAHHPVDVSSLSFIRSRDEGLNVVIKGVYVFEFEGLDNLKNSEFTVGVSLSSCAV
jgi:hypothetical protein